MVSEDSDHIVPGLAMVHGLRDVGDLNESFSREMTPTRDDRHALRELLEVASLRCPKRIPMEKRNDRIQMKHLVAGCVAPSARAIRLSHESD